MLCLLLVSKIEKEIYYMIEDFIFDILNNYGLTESDRVNRFLYLKRLLLSYDPTDAGIIELENEIIKIGCCPECGNELESVPYIDIHADEFAERTYKHVCPRCGKEID